VVGAIAVVVGRAAWELILKLLPGASSKGTTGISPEGKERLQRLDDRLAELRDVLRRLDELHQVRRGNGEPAVYCACHRLEPRVDEIHQMVGRILDEQRQSRGLLSRMARGLKISTRFRERDE
jgi:hypothetical protein